MATLPSFRQYLAGFRRLRYPEEPSTKVWKILAIVLLWLLATSTLIGTVPFYTTKPVFLLLTAITIVTTLLAGWAPGLFSLAASLVVFRFFVGAFSEPVRQRLFANVCVDVAFIGLITYMRYVADGRERARLAAVARAAELETALAALHDAHASAQERREVLEAVMEHIPMGVAIAEGPDLKIRAVSHYGRELMRSNDRTGITAAEYLHSCEVLRADGLTPASVEELPVARAARKGEIITGEEWVIVHEDGTKIPVLCTAAPIRDSEGHIRGSVIGWQDLRLRKRSEQALMQAEKLAATGRLAATIAHEINNPLAALTNIVYLLKKCRLDDEARDYVDLIDSQLRAVSRIAGQTLKFHRGHGQPIQFSLAEAVEEVVEFYQPKAKQHGVTIVPRIQVDGRVVGFVGEIRQVVSNLLLNAIEATSKGGTVMVHLHESADWRDGASPGYRIFVADTGSGIDPQHRARLFEPFFTTKGEKGTGLGLWVSAGIIQRAGGSMRVWSTRRPGRSGTCFSIFLPRGDAASAKAPARRRYESQQAQSA